MKSILRSCLAVLLAVALPSAVLAQTAQVGQVRGTVSDQSGGVLPGVTVTLTSEERGFVRSQVTDSQGHYLFPVVPLGTYTLTFALSNFETKMQAGNLVEAEKTTNVSTTLALARLEVSATVQGEVPIVDATNQTQQTRLRAEEFQKMPYGRSYLTMLEQAPGVVGTGNANAHGALRSNNLFLFDGVNTTDPTTGTFAANSNFEAIQELVVRTSAVGVEFGRASGAVVEVITKSGTNQLAGSFKYLMSNDDWNAQNDTVSETDGTSLARTKFDKINSRFAATLGGPIVRNKLWAFGAYEYSEITAPADQTNAAPGFPNEEFQETTTAPIWTVRVDSQLRPGQNLWFRYAEDPIDGFINDYWGTSAEREALTLQNQGGENYAVQYSGLIGNNLTATAMVAAADSDITVTTFEEGSLDNGAPYVDLNDFRFYNGATFDGVVSRPRKQATAAVEYFTTMAGGSHAIKAGFDWQGLESESHFRFPTNRLFYVTDFNPITRTFNPLFFEEYDDAPSVSKGNQVALYVRDKLQTGRLSVEPGVRLEWQTGESDIGASTVDTFVVAPRVSASVALTPDSRTLAVGSYGRFYDGILQGFSDEFANVPQQGNYNVFVWDGTQYVFTDRVEQGANSFMPNTDVSPRHLDEVTIGVERQLSNVLGVTARYIFREWGNFIDDVVSFNADGTLNRTVANIDGAERSYRGFEVTFEKRLSNRWSGSASYAYGQSRGNHFADVFTTLADFEDATCVSTDPGLASLPCRDVPANLDGKPTYDRPHQLKFNGAYTYPIGNVDLTAGFVGEASSKTTFSRTRTVTVLLPSGDPSGQTQTYFYEPRGSERVDGTFFELDFALEAAVRSFDRAQLGFKFETFNLFNDQDKININNTSWCNSTATAACQSAVTNFGTATNRGSFNGPRTFRFTFLVRY